MAAKRNIRNFECTTREDSYYASENPLQDSAHRPLKSSLNCDQDNEITAKTQTSEAVYAANLETSLALIPLRQ